MEQIEQNKDYSSDSGYAVAQSYANQNDDIQTAAQYSPSSYTGSAQYQPQDSAQYHPQQSTVYSYNQQQQPQQQQPTHFVVSKIFINLIVMSVEILMKGFSLISIFWEYLLPLIEYYSIHDRLEFA